MLTSQSGPELGVELAKKKGCCNSTCVLKFLFSEGGLAIVILIYIIGGGLLFRAIEYSGEASGYNATRYKALQIEVRFSYR